MCSCVCVGVCVAHSHRPIGVPCDGCVCLCLGLAGSPGHITRILITRVQHIDAQTQSSMLGLKSRSFSPLRSWYIESGIVKWHLIHFNSLSRVFLCNTPLLTNTFFFFPPRPCRDGYYCWWVSSVCCDLSYSELHWFCETSDKSQTGTRQECCHSKASLDHAVISPAVSLTRGGLFREAVQSGTVRCRLWVF